jgi:hypothetical protein
VLEELEYLAIGEIAAKQWAFIAKVSKFVHPDCTL